MTAGDMTPIRRYGGLATLACLVSQAQAGTWGMDPVFGVTADRSTNPQLLTVANTAETNGAVLLDAPTTYNADNTRFSLLGLIHIDGFSDKRLEVFSILQRVDSKRDTVPD